MINYSDYWLDDDFDTIEEESSAINMDLIKLSMSRRAISNFVHILTGKNIPVYFSSEGVSFTDGKSVYISSDINQKEDFDPAVGLALHEGSHILLSDFKLIESIWTKIPRHIYDLAQPMHLTKDTVANLVKDCWNYVEDRYIDYYVYSNAPGYRGYYDALYDKYFNSPKISVLLKSDFYRVPSIKSYMTRIINLTNENTNLEALPQLRKIAEIINLSNIQRLSTPKDRMNIAFKISEIILSNIKEHLEEEKVIGLAGDPNGDQIGGVPCDKKIEEKAMNDIGIDQNVSESKLKGFEKALSKQKDFINSKIKKKTVTKKERAILDAIEKSGMDMVKTGTDYINGSGKYATDTIVVNKLTRELIESDVFPLNYRERDLFRGSSKITIDPGVQKAVNQGLILGSVLGRKLQIRNELNTTKFMRKPIGKIDRRILSELSFDNENVFYNINVDQYKKSYLHISIDASASMRGEKWNKTMTSVVAICKAASMVNNLRVTVSFRTTFNVSAMRKMSSLPYVIFAYDSASDKINKIKTLFPYLYAGGWTPEGLTFEAISKYLPKTSHEEDNYFLNFSDGEPNMTYKSSDEVILSYRGLDAAVHTKKQINKIKNAGFGVLSYFIDDGYRPENLVNQFKMMYGNDASFVNPTNVVQVAKTMNKMFLEKSH